METVLACDNRRCEIQPEEQVQRHLGASIFSLLCVLVSTASPAQSQPSWQALLPGQPPVETSSIDRGERIPQARAGAARKPPQQPEMLEIDGAKTPDQIPEYLVWSTGFSTLALLKENKVREDEGPLRTLKLAPRDSQLVYAEVAQHTERMMRCHEKGQRIFRTLKGKGEKIDKIEAAMKANTLECRWALLEAKDQLIAALTPEGQASLTAWMLDERRYLKSYIPKQDLEFYRQPR